jgi:hypothetical protein
MDMQNRKAFAWGGVATLAAKPQRRKTAFKNEVFVSFFLVVKWIAI